MNLKKYGKIVYEISKYKEGKVYDIEGRNKDKRFGSLFG